ncbi:hypothetical protein KSS87_023436 [Heliosperma pusillum]|nr:hypothetical protein KSS87_023436 [Heliosperma pusillum]
MDPYYGSWYRKVSHPLIIDPDFVGADVTAETAHSLLEKLLKGKTIIDEREQARYFQSMLRDFRPLLLSRRDASHAAHGGRSKSGGRAGDIGADSSGDDSSDSFSSDESD